MHYENIILEMLERIKILEKEVAKLKTEILPYEIPPRLKIAVAPNEEHKQEREDSLYKTEQHKPVGRDKTKYLFEGNVYLKNRLVLAVVQAYVRDNPDITSLDLKAAFDKSLQGSIGVVENKEVAMRRNEYYVRFFTKPDEVIHVVDCEMYVCSQWGILNIPNFLKRASQLGYIIEEI